MRITQLAKQFGVSRFTIYRWAKKGIIPSIQLPSGRHILGTAAEIAEMQAPITNNAAIYLYIPLPETIDTEGEIAKLNAFANANGFNIDETVIEGSSYDTYLRKQLLRLLSKPTLRTILTTRQSLPPGWKFLSTALAASGRRLIVADAEKHHEREYRWQTHQTRFAVG